MKMEFQDKKITRKYGKTTLVLVSAIKYFVALIVPTLERGNDRTNALAETKIKAGKTIGGIR